MKVSALILGVILSHTLFAASSVTDFVDPMIGTDAHGHTYPGATLPFGLVQLSPDNGKSGWDWCSGYHYSCDTLVGFSHLHLSGTGCADLGDILFMPRAGLAKPGEKTLATFSHDHETARPGFYSVTLDNGIMVELTVTERVGFHRYTFSNQQSAGVAIDLGYGQDDSPVKTQFTVENDSTVTGYRISAGWSREQHVYFVAKFSQSIRSYSLIEEDDHTVDGNTVTSKRSIGSLEFGPPTETPLLIKVGISQVSIDGAKSNLERETPNWDFDAVRQAAHQTWADALDKVDVEAMTDADKRTFYTALYHSLLAPTLFCDADGTYRGGDGQIHHTTSFRNHCTFSLWDTYRAAHPLYTIVEPERVPDFVNSMLAFERESGLLPVWNLQGCETWCMIGYHSIPVIADAYLKGFTGFDSQEALRAMQKSAYQNERGLQYYNLVEPKPMREKIAELRLGAQTPPQELREKATMHSPFLRGYANSLDGQVIHYHSSYEYVKDALLVRATDGTMQIEWQTDPVPAQLESEKVTFVWVAGLCTFRGGHRFDLYGDNEHWLSFNSARDTTEKFWTVQGKNGVSLTFLPTYLDVYDDFFGEAYLTVPIKLLKPGQPVTLRVVGENGGSSDWYMTFEHATRDTITIVQEYALADSNGSAYQILSVQVETLEPKPSQELRVELEGREPMVIKTGALLPGLTIVDVPIPAVDKPTSTHIQVGSFSDNISLRPVEPYGYIPADKEHESVSKTLEYAYDDWCIAQTAKAMGREDVADRFTERSNYYKNLFDASTGFMRGRNSDGAWVSPFDPRFGTEKQPQYTEGNAWQYSWYVPQDVHGLIALHGGRANFVGKLDSLFEHSSDLDGLGNTSDVTGLIGMYAHGNEPSHHIAYLYNYANEPAKTQRRVRQIMRDFYTDRADGLCGNEDCGQMSAWYVFSAMGFYPVNPADQTYQIGTPLLKSASIKVGDKTFRMTAKNLSEENMYVQSVTMNGKPVEDHRIHHADIASGGTLEFQMGPSPK
jgi:putative alpha-1,2-mannosidase